MVSPFTLSNNKWLQRRAEFHLGRKIIRWWWWDVEGNCYSLLIYSIPPPKHECSPKTNPRQKLLQRQSERNDSAHFYPSGGFGGDAARMEKQIRPVHMLLSKANSFARDLLFFERKALLQHILGCVIAIIYPVTILGNIVIHRSLKVIFDYVNQGHHLSF